MSRVSSCKGLELAGACCSCYTPAAHLALLVTPQAPLGLDDTLPAGCGCSTLGGSWTSSIVVTKAVRDGLFGGLTCSHQAAVSLQSCSHQAAVSLQS